MTGRKGAGRLAPEVSLLPSRRVPLQKARVQTPGQSPTHAISPAVAPGPTPQQGKAPGNFYCSGTVGFQVSGSRERGKNAVCSSCHQLLALPSPLLSAVDERQASAQTNERSIPALVKKPRHPHTIGLNWGTGCPLQPWVLSPLQPSFFLLVLPLKLVSAAWRGVCVYASFHSP